MANVKTAISIEKPIFDKVTDIAKRLNVSRSRLFAMAARDFIEHYNNVELLQAINDAYDDRPDDDTNVVHLMHPRHLKMVRDQW